MKNRTDWNDIAYFAAIARAGGLARAADDLGVSAATLSRRMKAFEAASGRRLFLHGADGYALTADGRALADRTRMMEAAARQIDMWRDGADGPVSVRISAGSWTALDLAEHLNDYWTPEAPWRPEFMHADLDLDIARREIDIGLRNRRPEQPWVARQQLGHVDYAVYAAGRDVTGWIGASGQTATTPSLRWVQDRHADAIVSRANSPYLARAMVQAGIGCMVLPMFVAEKTAGLQRLSDPIAELRSEQWLVSHHDARNEPPVRAALDAIAGYLTGRA